VTQHLRTLDWSALRDFLAVAECGSLSAAARRLGVSQPTLTRRMAALQRSLGAELLQRGARGLELTESGEAILGPARQMAQEVQAIELAASGRDQALAGTVRLTATEGLAVEWLTPALASFRALHPRIPTASNAASFHDPTRAAPSPASNAAKARPRAPNRAGFAGTFASRR
jgi:DNA-binding transcriptional LysR family regulator